MPTATRENLNNRDVKKIKKSKNILKVLAKGKNIMYNKQVKTKNIPQ